VATTGRYSSTESITGANVPYYVPYNQINSNITDAIVMKNTNKGYSYFITAQLQKSFTSGFLPVPPTRIPTPNRKRRRSIAQSIWRDRVVSG
jgi:hypothetical protein